MSSYWVSDENSSNSKSRGRRRGNKEPTDSRNWPVSFQRNGVMLGNNDDESESGSSEGTKRILTKKTFNYLQSVHKLIPFQHVHSLLKQITINEDSIKNPDSEESVIRSIFYIRSINFVKVMGDYLVLGLVENHDSTNIPYLVNRFNSYGDSYFHQKAQQIEAINQAFANQPARPKPSPEVVEKKKMMIEEFLSSVKGRAFFAKIAGENILVSKELLRLLGKDPEQFARECLQYRAILDESFFTAVDYRFALDQTLQFVSLNIEHMMGKLSMSDVLEKADVTYPTELRGRNETKVKVMLRSYMPNPFLFCAMVEKVLGQEKIPSAKLHKIEGPSRQNYVQELLASKDKLVSKLNPEPIRKPRPDDSHLRCSYQPIPSEQP